MKPRLILVSLGLAALTLVALGTQAQEQTKGQKNDDIITSEQQLKRQFGDFQELLLRLQQRLARGTPEERKRAVVLGKVLDECRNLAINQEFTKMIELMRNARLDNLRDLGILTNQSDDLTKRLRKILDMLQDSRSNLSEERRALERILKDLQAAIDAQKQTQGLTDLSKTDKKDLHNLQNKTTEQTGKVEKDIGKYLNKDKDGQGGEAKNLTGKDKEGKGTGAKGEAKDAGKQAQGAKGEAKDGGKDSKAAKGEAKAGEGKEAKPGQGEPKAGSKPGEKGKEGPQAGAKGDKGQGKEGASKDNQGQGKEGAAKGDPKGKDGQQGAAKGGEKAKQNAPDSSAKKGNPDDKQAGAKDAKGGDKAGDPKAGGDPKSAQGDAKSGESKSGQGEAKAGGSPSKGGGDPKEGQPSAKGGDSPPSSSPPGGDKGDQDVAKSQKKIIEAGYDQKSAEDNIKKGENPKASKAQGDAIDKLEQAKKQLEKLLQQMREEEIERVLAALQARCEKMLMMQIQVLAGTKDVHASIQKRPGMEADRADKAASLKLSDQEKDIVQEANKCIDILESEGSAVAFPEVFQQIRQDMIHVQKRLGLVDVKDVTQGIEQDIIDTLKEMIDALKKAREENADPSKSKQGKSKPGKQGDQKLLELLQELKMVRSLQKRVNDRTKTYARQFPGQEQTNDPQIVRELRNLAERQLRIQEIVSRIAKGDNK